MMKAILKLESEELVKRVSPRKFLMMPQKGSKPVEMEPSKIGFLNFRGHILSDFANDICDRIYDRNLEPHFSPDIISPIRGERVSQQFFKTHYRFLLSNGFGISYEHILRHRERFDTLIQLFSSNGNVPMPSHRIYLDESFFIFDALKRLHQAGFKKVHIFDAAPRRKDSSNPKDHRMAGYDKFMQEVKASDFRIHVSGYFDDIKYNDEQKMKWLRALPADTEAIICNSDFQVIRTKEWISQHTDIDHRQILFIGKGNTHWSMYGPDPFPSYDFKVKSFIDICLEIIDEQPSSFVEKRLRPKAMRMEILQQHLNA